MIAVDSNILVYAHRGESPWHQKAYSVLKDLLEGNDPLAIPWQCLREFYSIVSNPRIYKPATSSNHCLEQIEAWLESPCLEIISEEENYKSHFLKILRECHIQGAQVHDAHIAALCIAKGFNTIYTQDRDFSRFKGLTVVNPLI